MIDSIAAFFYQSEQIESTQFLAYCEDGKVVEQDNRGIKVLMLSNGDYLKVFKLRGLFSSSLFFSNARSFIRNAKRLRSLNIPTVEPIKLFHFFQSSDTAVLYSPLVGDTVRHLLDKNTLSGDKLSMLGSFIARLHREGIHFKSLHFGNIVLTPEGNYGLIDIADMKIFLWPLTVNTRIRSLKRIQRYQEDMQKLGSGHWALLINAYLEAAKLNRKQREIISQDLIN